MLDCATVPLGIPDVRILKTEINARGELILTIESRRCGRIGLANYMDKRIG
jgi:hypothetical protein